VPFIDSFPRHARIKPAVLRLGGTSLVLSGYFGGGGTSEEDMTMTLGRWTYATAQAIRVSWYFGQYAVAARVGRILSGPAGMPARPAGMAMPDMRTILREIRDLLERDWRNIEAGLYRLPHDLIRRPAEAVEEAALFFKDVPEVARRRREKKHREVYEDGSEGPSGLPRYYLQNFHYQTDGYLSDRSARLYDHQVEVLFGGGAAAMRRQALVPIAEYFQKHPVRTARLLDVAGGTGQFLTYLKDNYPRLDVTVLDLSRPYLAEARRRSSRWPCTHFVQAAAESIPAPDARFDIVTSLYLFHELPRKIRLRAVSEMARVLKPGGRLVFMDSLQMGDRPHLDSLLEFFPAAFHEPYYSDYIRHDLVPLFTRHGLMHAQTDHAFLSKILVFDKPIL